MQNKNIVALITGAGSGIGQSTALYFAEKGAKVIVSDIKEAGGLETVQLIKEKGGDAHFIRANVAEYGAVEHLIEQSVAHYGRIDVAVNNAGIGAKNFLRTAEHTLEDWDRVIAVNQTGVFYCMKLELQQMEKQGSGCIVNVASIAGLKGFANNLSYAASKHAVVGMTKTAALEYAQKNIRINAICPAFTYSPLFQRFLNAKPEIEPHLKKGIPMQRFAEAKEIAEAIWWLSSEASGFVTGLALPIDGGMSA